MTNLQNITIKEKPISANLKIILDTSESLKRLKSIDIKFSQPILTQEENAVIFPRTINAIQGQAGVHKSRLAEIICAAFMKLHNCNNELLGFKRTNFNAIHSVVYVDTERNLSEQLPYALQAIQIKAGYEKEENPINFDYVSLLQINRQDRFAALNEYLTYIKQKKPNTPLFIVLDVSTDCIEDFNQTAKSMELIDLMNIAVNEHDVTFLCIIHENPKSDKARGHFGTELMNKASTFMQVGFEKDAKQNDTDVIRVKYLKCRSTAKHTPFYIKYSKESGGLVLADASDVASAIKSRNRKATQEQVIELLCQYLGDGSSIDSPELVKKLAQTLDSSARTIADRITNIMETELKILNESGKECTLSKITKKKHVFYKLLPIETI